MDETANRLCGSDIVKLTTLLSMSFRNKKVVLFCFFVSVCFYFPTSAWGAPYPQEGLQTEWVQPDGTRLSLRVFGDEFYGRTTTEDGYTVIFVPKDKTYYYAILGDDGESLVSSKISAGKKPPDTLIKHLLESSDAIAKKRAMSFKKLAPNQ